jgi:uncharacterized integral membrane protein
LFCWCGTGFDDEEAMADTWLKFKFWLKVVILGVVLLYAIIFAILNSHGVSLWVFFGLQYERIPLVLIILGAIVLGVLGTVFARTVLRTLQQMRELKRREEERAKERDAALWREQKAKADRLQTRDKPPAPEEPMQ